MRRVVPRHFAIVLQCNTTSGSVFAQVCEGADYGAGCDVWSLGILLHELMLLRPPFFANSMPALVLKICTEAPPPLPEARAGGRDGLAKYPTPCMRARGSSALFHRWSPRNSASLLPPASPLRR